MNLKTGDIILCDYTQTTGFFGAFSWLIKHFTNSNYSHCAMIIKDPSFIHPSLKGTYVWESSWEGKPDPQDGKIKLGVQITPFQEFYDSYKKHGNIFLRKFNSQENIFTDDILKKIHSVVYDKPYDIVPIDWIEAYKREDNDPQKTSRFWCSALLGYIYTQVGILEKDTDWTILRPSDFSSIENPNLKLLREVILDKDTEI